MSKVGFYDGPRKSPEDAVNASEGCFMVQHFSPCAKVGTLFGCFFIRNLGDRSLDKARATWRSFYTLYAVAWLALLLSVEAFVAYSKIAHADVGIFFTDILATTVHICSFLTSIINISCMALGSRKLLDLFREAALFEVSSGIARLVRQRVDRGRWFRAFRRVGVAASATATFGCCVAIIIDNHLNDNETAWSYGLPVLFIRLLSQVGFAFWECTMYIVVSSISEVLVSYLRSQKCCLRECQRCVQEQRSDDLTAALAVEAIRKNMSAIRKMKTCINVIWEPAILAFSLCFLWVHCIAWYCLFTEEAYHLRIWLGLAYSCYSSLRFLDLAVVSHDLCNEARGIQQVSKDANLVHVSDTYMRQIHFLHDSADPEAMRLTGGQFFYIDRTLLVSMAGSVITYTVILVQTNHGFSSHTSACLGNATT